MVNIKGINKAELLAALYNNSKPQGMGILQYEKADMTKLEAEELLNETMSFDYLKGRVMKIDLNGNEMREFGYDRDIGGGSVQRIVNSLIK